MVYCTADDVREICDIDSSDLDDTALGVLIARATSFLNQEINVTILEEEAEYIGQYRENKKDGSNTVYYVQDSWVGHDGKATFIGDRTDSGTLTVDDVEVYIYDSTSKTRTQATVSSIDATLGKITLSSAPEANQHVFITYARSPVDEATPSILVKEACRSLAAAMGYINLRAADFRKLRLGDLTLDSQEAGKGTSFDVFYADYFRWVDRINQEAMNRIKNDRVLQFQPVFPGDI